MEFPEITLILMSTAITLAVFFYMKLSKRYQYWKERGISQLTPLPFFGNMLPVVCFKKSMGEMYKDAYLKFPNKRVAGVYEMMNPVLVIIDPVLIEKIMVRDFQHFTDHTMITEDVSLFAEGLFLMKGNKWRSVRYKISPAFSSGKLKGMFQGMLDCTDEMLQMVDKHLNKDYAVREAVAAYTVDVIANTVFGIQVGDRQTREDFLRMGSSVFNTTPGRFFHSVIIAQFPKLAKFMGMTFLSEETDAYFHGLIKNTLQQREMNNIQRNDYTQQLLKLKQKGGIEIQGNKEKDDEYLHLDDKPTFTDNIEISEELLAGQAFQFLSAGFDPLLITTVNVLYDLSLNPQVQERLRQHINEVVAKHNGYSYACMQDMTYLEQCIQETLRMHVLTPFLFRQCTKNYYLEEEKLFIKKGQKIVIPLNAIHMDIKYHDNPEVYNPDRLEPNNIKNNFTYLPFGDGPRICIGVRYALVTMKLGLAKLLTHYKFKLSPKTKVPFDINKQSILSIPKNNIIFNITKI